MKHLNLERTQLNNKNLFSIEEALTYSTTLEILDLRYVYPLVIYSGNQITDQGAYSLAKIIQMNNKLKVFMIHWNKIRQRGGLVIGEALQKNNTLEILDISFNNIGGGTEETNCANALKEAFRINTSLIHVDISFCGLLLDEILTINEGLTENHTIWGIH